ncbi:MAG: hypothetical protein LBQ63_02150 [Deltaproteobacteria bacterium]|jgi:hypothetical protein|nr:hypothetical protein [Deltaproteobacteria bacterium]
MGKERKYLIFKDVQRDGKLKAYFDGCVRMVLEGTARISGTRSSEPQHPCFRYEGEELLLNAVTEYYLRDPYFYNKNTSGDSWKDEWVLKPEEAHAFIPEDFFRFACYIALCHMKYGASYNSVTANRIFAIVSALGSDLPARLKKHGRGKPAPPSERKTRLLRPCLAGRYLRALG